MLWEARKRLSDREYMSIRKSYTVWRNRMLLALVAVILLVIGCTLPFRMTVDEARWHDPNHLKTGHLEGNTIWYHDVNRDYYGNAQDGNVVRYEILASDWGIQSGQDDSLFVFVDDGGNVVSVRTRQDYRNTNHDWTIAMVAFGLPVLLVYVLAVVFTQRDRDLLWIRWARWYNGDRQEAFVVPEHWSHDMYGYVL